MPSHFNWTLTLHIPEVPNQTSSRKPPVLNKDFSIQKFAGIISETKPKYFPFVPLSIHYAPITVSFDTTDSVDK
jgi:hypothetical protein